MKGRTITDEKKSGVGDCIRTHPGGDAGRTRTPEDRDTDYEPCLENCSICD